MPPAGVSRKQGGFTLYAIIETGGKQYRVEEGQTIRVELLDGQDGDTVEFDKVLLAKSDERTLVGNPYVEGARVSAKILEHAKARKILVFRYRSKTNIRRRYGHRQPFTKLTVDSIQLPG